MTPDASVEVSGAMSGIQNVQKARKGVLLVMLLLGVALVFSTQSLEPVHGWAHDGIEAFGLGLILIAIVGRAWSSLYIGGRKREVIVDRGPYSISRNPLYVFSFFGAFGIGAQSGSLTIALLFLAAAILVFRLVVAREEAWLLGAFGEDYAAYMKRTPRFWPNFSRWRDEDSLEVRPAFFLLTLRDGLVFLLAIPLFEAVDWMQEAGWLHAILRLP